METGKNGGGKGDVEEGSKGWNWGRE